MKSTKSSLKLPPLPSAGVVLIDKPSGLTSHHIVNLVRQATGVKRVGHAGTLDPLATGLLIILISRQFTKQQSKFLKQDKQYLVTGQLGLVTDSYDTDGQVVKEAGKEEVGKVTQKDLEKALPAFTGQITQTVPAYSAVKVGGRKMYQLARKGQVDVKKLPRRQITIHSIKLVNFDQKKKQFTLEVDCSSGTYIRSLVHDLGQRLGVGATVTQLRRTKIGQLLVDQAIKLN